MPLCTQTTDYMGKTAHTSRPKPHLSAFKAYKPCSNAHTQTPTHISSFETHRPYSLTHTINISANSKMHPQSLSTHTFRKNMYSPHNKTHIPQEMAHTLSTSMHILDSSADYLEHQLNQLARAQQDEEHEIFTVKETSVAPAVSTPSLLTILLTSPQKTGFSESTGVDLLSDHGSTSGHSTPTPPLLLHFASRPSVKFAAPPLGRTNTQELTHELLPILQPPCFQQGFQQGLQIDSTTERSQHHVRFQASIVGTDGVSGARTVSGGTGTGVLLDRLNHSGEIAGKTTSKILLDHVLPKEKMNLIVQDEDELEEDLDAQEEDLEDDLDDDAEKLKLPQRPRGVRMPQWTQKNMGQTCKDFSGLNLESEKPSVNHDNVKHHYFESTSYQSIIAASYSPLQKYLIPSADDVNEHPESFPESLSKKTGFQDDMDLVLGCLDEDQFNIAKSESHLHTFDSQGTAQRNIDPTFLYSYTDESDSTSNSLLENQHPHYHPSPSVHIKRNPAKTLSIKSLPGQKKAFSGKQYFARYFDTNVIHTVNIPLHRDTRAIKTILQTIHTDTSHTNIPDTLDTLDGPEALRKPPAAPGSSAPS